MKTTITLNAETLRFLEYLRTFKKRFFGKNSLGIVGFIGIYLNYDTDYNPFRQSILNGKTLEGDEQEESVFKSEAEMTRIAIKFIKSVREEMADDTILNEAAFLGQSVKISKGLGNAVAEAIKVETNNLHDFMKHVLSYKPNKTLLNRFFKEAFGLSYKHVMEGSERFFYNLYDSKKMIRIPEEYEKYIKEIDGRREEFKFYCREDLKENMWKSMLKFEGNNVCLVAEYDDLAYKYIYNMAYEMEHDISCPARPEKIFLEVDLEKVFFDIDLGKKSEIATLKEIVSFLCLIKNKENFVVYVRYSNELLKTGSDGYLFISHFYPLFMDEDIKVFIDLNSEDLKTVCSVYRFVDLFELIVSDPPTKKEFFAYMEGSVFDLSIHHGVYADERSVEVALQFVKALDFAGNCSGTRSLIDYSMGHVNNAGRNVLVETDYIERYTMSFKSQDKQSDEFKRLVAYHEAGHFVISRFAKYYTAVYSDLVSVVSVSDFGGVNIMEFDNNELRGNDFEFYLESLALTLGGRASEDIFLDSISAGAVSDLEQATELATAMVSSFGLDKSKKIKGNENLTSEKSLNEVSDKVNEILEEAYDLATNMLTEHKEYVDSLAKKLMQMQVKIISREDIMRMETSTDDGKIYIK